MSADKFRETAPTLIPLKRQIPLWTSDKGIVLLQTLLKNMAVDKIGSNYWEEQVLKVQAEVLLAECQYLLRIKSPNL